MATKLLYLEDFAVLTCEATVEDIQTVNEQTAVVLDQTCFYPRGGGQDWDTGHITTEAADFIVNEVRLDETGTVWHYGAFTRGRLVAGERVHGQADAQRRSDNTRLHSAGHVVDMAVAQLGLPWTPGRGAHYPHMSFVEYSSDEQLTDDIAGRLQQQVDALVKSDYHTQIRFMPVSEMSAYCRHIPDNLPTNKPSRIVLYADDFGIPCGGTRVRRLRDIGTVTITKLKAKKGLIKVSYTVAGIN